MKAQKVIDHIVNWMKSYVEQSTTNGFVIGISGGIDSAVTSAMAARTGLPLTCVEMPIHQHPDQVNRAAKHIDDLMSTYSNVVSAEVDLTKVFDDMSLALPQGGTDKQKDLALANTRARLRMTTLYYIAGLNNYLVLGTGNKVEDFGVGFFTKYGDGGVDLSPIADLIKSEVYELGLSLGIIDEIQNAKPTDGLWGDHRTDEDQIGATYPELEWVMEQAEKGKKAEDFRERSREVFEIYSKLNRQNQHKMISIPICKIPGELRE